MKQRLLTGLALVLALGGCTTYGYVDDGGGYYTGGASTRYVYPAYGGYDAYGYGAYGYGSPYYGYAPGWSFGLGYGYGYGYGHGSGYPYYPGYHRPYYDRPPQYYPRPPRPDHHHGGSDHGGRPDGHRPPPVTGGDPPPLNRAPWRDLERMRRGDGNGNPPRRQPGPGTLGVAGPGPDEVPGLRQGGSARPMPPPGYRIAAPRPGGVADDDRGMSRPAPRSSRSEPRSASRFQETRDSGPSRIGTPDTIEP